MDVVKHNQVMWDIQSNQAESPWVKPVSRDEIAGARAGNWQVILTPTKPVPFEWFGNIRGKELLGLASGGGQQVPLFAAAGAQVTSFDNSPAQLAKDEYVALRDGLDIAYERAIWQIYRGLMTRPLTSYFTRYPTSSQNTFCRYGNTVREYCDPAGACSAVS